MGPDVSSRPPPLCCSVPHLLQMWAHWLLMLSSSSKEATPPKMYSCLSKLTASAALLPSSFPPPASSVCRPGGGGGGGDRSLRHGAQPWAPRRSAVVWEQASMWRACVVRGGSRERRAHGRQLGPLLAPAGCRARSAAAAVQLPQCCPPAFLPPLRRGSRPGKGGKSCLLARPLRPSTPTSCSARPCCLQQASTRARRKPSEPLTQGSGLHLEHRVGQAAPQAAQRLDCARGQLLNGVVDGLRLARRAGCP